MMTDSLWYGWEKVRRIGRGGYGEVYEIRRTIGSHIEKAALKLIRIPLDASEIERLQRNNYSIASITKRYEQQRDQIVQEYQMMQQLRGNPNIVQCNDIQIDPNPDGFGWQIGIRMELLTPLERYLGKNITQQQVIDVGVQICNALIACKKNNIIHRDIKADNILVAMDGTVKLGDFGIAKVSEFTAPGTSIGTPGFEAPEVYNHREYGASADLYSLGLVLYWMLNERTKPFLPLPPEAPTALQEAEARERRYRGEPLPAPKNGSPELKKIVLKAAAYQPCDRYASAWDMQQALLALSGGGSSFAGKVFGTERTYDSDRTEAGSCGDTTEASTQYRYTRGTTESTFRNQATEKTRSQTAQQEPKKMKSGPEPSKSVPPKSVSPKPEASRTGASAQLTPSATRKKPLGKRVLRIVFLILVLIPFVAMIGSLLQKAGFGGNSSGFLIGGGVRGVEVTDIPGNDVNTLTPLGSFADHAFISDSTGLQARTDREMEGISSQVYLRESTTVYSMLNFLGQDTYGLSVIASSNLGNDLFTVQAAVNEVNGIGLINLAGEVLLQPEAAMIGWPNYADDGRYILVGYATEKASLGGEWQVNTDSGFRKYPSEYNLAAEGTKYQGYTMVFDLVNRQFVPGIRLENFDWERGRNCGDYFAIVTTDKKSYTNALVVYDAEGNVVADYDQIASVSEFAIAVEGENEGIYDFAGNKLMGGDNYYYQLMEQYVIRSEWAGEKEKEVLLNRDGNIVLEAGENDIIEWYSNDWLRDGRIMIQNAKHKSGLLNMDGEEVLPCAYSFINYLGSGYFEAARKVGIDTYGFTLVDEKGVIAEDIRAYGNQLVYVEDNHALILNNRSFDLALDENGNWRELAPALMSYKAPDSVLWCVYDLFTGKQLLPAEYSDIKCINNKYVYAQKDGIWEIYELQSTFTME